MVSGTTFDSGLWLERNEAAVGKLKIVPDTILASSEEAQIVRQNGGGSFAPQTSGLVCVSRQ